MPVSGLLIHTKPDQSAALKLSAAMEGHAAFEVGQRDGCRIAAALDTADEHENKEAWRWLNDRPEVAFVDVVCVYFEEIADEQRETVLPRDLRGDRANEV